MSAQLRFRALLDSLGIEAGAVVYLHTSFSRLSHLELSPEAFIETLIAHLGPAGTLVMPSFTWNLDRTERPWKGYADYYRERPVFDVRHSPANIGLIPELFRQRRGVRRSVNFWWSVAARGPLADEVTRDQHAIAFHYGPDSSFGRLHRLGATVLGLGVTLNTTSLAPVVDHVLGERHTQIVFSPQLEEGVVVDEAGRQIVTRSHWLLPDVVRLIKPSVVCDRIEGPEGGIRRADHGDVIQFAYPFESYFEVGMALGDQAAAERRAMPWLERYPIMKSDSRLPLVK